MKAIFDTWKSEVVSMSSHATERCRQRNISAGMITQMFPVLLEFGKWNRRNDRLIFKPECEEFYQFIKDLKLRLMEAKFHLKELKKQKADDEVIADFKNKFKLLNKFLKNIIKAEHKEDLTLVIEGNCIITVYMQSERIRNDTF